jgi:hemerythrin-like domain-containing protein
MLFSAAQPTASAAPALAQIRAEHRALLRVIGAMQALVAAWRAAGARPQAELFGAMLRYIEDSHGRQLEEDQVLFQAIARRSKHGRQLIASLRLQRAEAARMVAGTRAALARLDAAGPRALEGLATAVEELAELAWWHVQRVEGELLPLAQAILPEAAWREIAEKMVTVTIFQTDEDLA